MNNTIKYITIIVLTGLLTGCSVFMAAKQPSKKNLNVLTVGYPRALLIAEFGSPINTDFKDGNRTDIFSFRQGYSKGAKTARAVGHGVADVFTLGLWEVVGTPTEAVFDGEETAVEVTYDSNDKVIRSSVLKKK